MNLIEQLYYKYYQFQVRVGHGDIAPFSAMLLIVFILFLYIIDILMILNFALGIKLPKINNIFFLMILGILVLLFYILLVGKGKYKSIIRKYEGTYDKSSKLGMILFPLLAFILFNIGWILKMLQNQGKL